MNSASRLDELISELGGQATAQFKPGGSAYKALNSLLNSNSLAKKGLGALGGLPVQPLDVLKLAKSYVGMRDESLRLGLFIDPRLSDDFIAQLTATFEPADEKTRVFVHVLSNEMVLGEQISYDALIVVVQRADMARALVRAAYERELPVLVIVSQGLRRDAADAYGISILDVASARREDLLTGQVAGWFAENLKEHRISLAADFAFMRPALANATIMASARQNAIIAFVFLVPGADLPVLTLNQIKMVLQIAFIYGEELTWERAAEAVVVIGSAFATRSLARALSQRYQMLAWPLKGAIAFGTTLALGKAMEQSLRIRKQAQVQAPAQVPVQVQLSQPVQIS